MKWRETIVKTSGSPRLNETNDDNRYTLTLVPDVHHPAKLERIAVVFSFDFHADDRLFCNGYQSWTYSPERSVHGMDKALRHCPGWVERKFGFTRYGDGWFYPPRYQKGVQHGYSYAYVRRGETYYLFGSLCEDTGFTRITFDTHAGTVTFEKDCAGRMIDSPYIALDVVHVAGREQVVFNAWFDALNVTPLPAPKAVGYSSWYNRYQNINRSALEKDLAGLLTLPVKPDVFQIDDGYARYVGDWLDADPVKFPDGMAPVAERILASGMRAGLWLAPFVCEAKSALYNDHPDWLLKDAQGQPVYSGSNWSGAYALDIYHPEVRDYLRRCFATYRAMGFTLFKLDFLYAACMRPTAHKTRGEMMADGMKLLREICGDAAILACGVPLASAFGRVEYCRIGPDISLAYNDVPFMRLFHAERPSTKHTVRNTVFRRQLNGRVFWNDPDVFILRDHNTSLSAAQKDMLGTVNSLFGGVLFASDEFDRYSDAQKEQYARLCRLHTATNVEVEQANDTGLTVGWLENGEHKSQHLAW